MVDGRTLVGGDVSVDEQMAPTLEPTKDDISAASSTSLPSADADTGQTAVKRHKAKPGSMWLRLLKKKGAATASPKK
jgi:hypothetical protein